MSQALEDQVAVVVGASSGMGKQTALSLSRAGASVVVAARSEDPLRELAAEIGAGAMAFQADDLLAEDPASLERLVAASVERFGRIASASRTAPSRRSGRTASAPPSFSPA